MSEYAGLPSPKRFQHLLNPASWNAEALRDRVRGYVLAALADVDGASGPLHGGGGAQPGPGHQAASGYRHAPPRPGRPGAGVRVGVADSGYGRDPKLRAFCHQHTVAYVFARRWTRPCSTCAHPEGIYEVEYFLVHARHVTVCMLAHAFLAVTRATLGKDQPADPRRAPD
jgi:hypothetical protein